MSKVKEINILTTDKSWWKMVINDIAATKDSIIANMILAQNKVLAGRIWEDEISVYIDKPVFINTANIIAIEIIRESEEE